MTSLNLLKKSRLSIPMNERDDYLNEFQLDNDGDLIFSRFDRVNNENIGEAALVIKYAQADSFLIKKLDIEKKYLDEIRIKPDNYNKRYIVTSFYYKQTTWKCRWLLFLYLGQAICANVASGYYNIQRRPAEGSQREFN